MNSSDPHSNAEQRRGTLLELLGMHATTVESGHVCVHYTVGANHLRTQGIAHGGVIATLMDTSLGLAAATKAPVGLDVVTAQINVNFIRPAWEGERLKANAQVQHAGRKTAVVTGEIRTEAGSLVATGSATLVYIPTPDLSKTDDVR